MAETRRTEQALPPELAATDRGRELPPAGTRSNPHLNEAAAAIGGTLGIATRQVQNVRNRFTVIRGGAAELPAAAGEIKQTAQQKLEEIKKRASSAVEQARIQATARLEDARATASRALQNARESAAERARMLRCRAARLANERPLAVLAGIGAAAFLAGIVLRLGRSKRG